ncbi:MAG TPA: clostripain-related cysteine peptidase [Clostridia bacterium]|nr:clostripain-related cysteine peptidase [Clostridia bacterium]
MKRIGLVLLCIILICLLLVGCDPGRPAVEPEPTPNGEEQETPVEKNYVDGTYTLMIYMCGSNLETKGGHASRNITEMLSAELPEDTKVIIQTGGSNTWRKYDISSVFSSRYEIKDNTLNLIEQNSNVNMGNPKSLSDFLLWGDEHYPAEHRSVILWDHGGGSMKGVCNDEQFGFDAISLPELDLAFSTAYTKSKRKYDFVGFDACLMATYDVACLVQTYADYMIASEELEPASGWSYKGLLENLGKDGFYTTVLNAYAEKQSSKTTYTLSAIKLSELSRVDTIIDGIIALFNDDLSYVGYALSIGKEFGVKGMGDGTNLFDLGLLAEALFIEYDFSDFITNVNGPAHATATGLSIYFPTEQQALLDEYSEICKNQRYKDFLVGYFNYRPVRTIWFSDPGFTDDNIHTKFLLVEQSKKYVQTVGYELHSYAGSEETQRLYVVGTDNDYSIDENGAYVIDFEGRWVYINDMLLHCDVYEEKPTHTLFAAPVLINDELSYIIFAYFESIKKIKIEGYVLADDITSRVNELTVGMEVTIIYKDPIPVDDILYYEEGTVIWEEGTEIVIKNLDAERYQYIPFVIDIYGDIYYANTATLYFDGTTCTIEEIAAG